VRHNAGHLTAAQFQDLQSVMQKARAGDWTGAEKDGYEFRSKHPFVREGQ
jgi:hypothetical protein